MKLRQVAAMPSRIAYRGLLRRVRVGSVHIGIAGLPPLTGSGDRPGPSASLTIHRPGAVLWRLGRGGGVGFAEAYLAGDWDTDDLPLALETLGLNLDSYVRSSRSQQALGSLRKLWQRVVTRRRSEISSIADHYNLGNEFYTRWLDETMTYSSAVFTEQTATLAQAQTEKYRRLAELADLKADDHVLEIGCGWGGFAEYAATEIGCRVTGLTLSTEQAEYARDRLKAAGVDHLTDVKLLDFRDETGSYDKIVSIEMIESIPADLWPALFESISENLRPGGRVAMQAITIAEDLYESLLDRDDFISKHVFPGGALPSVAKVRSLAADNGLAVVAESPYATSYATTLHKWRESFEQTWPSLSRDDLDERFRRTWRYYLAYCEAGFRIGRIDVHQVGFAR